jgi:anti-sigma B factor antagonist
MEASIEMTTQGDSRQLKIAGEFSIYSVTELKQALFSHLEQAQKLVMDLSEVAELDTAGVQLLLLLKRTASAEGKDFILARHSEATLEVVQLLNLQVFFGESPMPAVESGV